MPSPLIEFPLPAWPREAFPFEPAHGYFRRLAVANAQVSVRTLGSYVGVNGRNFDREELLEFCSRAFPRWALRTSNASPRKSKVRS